MTSILDTEGPAAGWMRALVLVATAVLLALAAAYMARTVWIAGASKDFAYFWIAGRIWMEGGNPYDPGFSAAANAIAAGNPEMEGLGGFHRWLYAPHIWGLSVGLGSLGYEAARLLWGAVSGILILAGSWLTLAAVLDPRGRFFPLVFGVVALLAATTHGTAAALATGQPTALTFFALASLAYGVLRRSLPALVAGFLVLTLKPSLALPFIAVALVVPPLWLPLAIAGAIALLLSLPVLLGTAPGALVSGYLDGLAAYGQYEANAPSGATGLRNLAHHLFGLDASGMVLILTGALVAVAIAWADRAGRAGEGPVLTAAGFAAIVATALLFVPLHTYELTLALVLLVLANRGGWGFLGALGVALVLLFRPGRLSALLGLVEEGTRFSGSLLSSLVLLGLFTLTVATFLTRRGQVDDRGRAP